MQSVDNPWTFPLVSAFLVFYELHGDNDASLTHRDVLRINPLKVCKALSNYADGSYKSPSDRKT